MGRANLADRLPLYRVRPGDEMEQQPPGRMGGEELDPRLAGYSG